MFQFNNIDLDNYHPNDSFATGSKKITPGPYRATKLWNGIVKLFRNEMVCKKHRRHFRVYQNCFTSSEAVDFLHRQLKSNANIGKDVSRVQTIQLLKKFLKNHVIEDVTGKWGTENFEDDGKLFRFQSSIPISKHLRKPLTTITENDVPSEKPQEKKSKKKNRKSFGDHLEPSIGQNNNQEPIKVQSNSKQTPPSPQRPLPPVPEFPQCKVTTRNVSDDEIHVVWRSDILNKLKDILQVDSLSDMVIEDDIKGSFIKHNCTKIGRSGVVQVDKEVDLPYWALSAMTCLANWPHGRETGLPCYPGFEKDVYKAVCAYYCGGENAEKVAPLLTYDLYELFTNIVCLLQPSTLPRAIEATRHALLLLPPENRRKLHLLLRLLSKMSKNAHLNSLSHGKHMSTRYLLINTFAPRILGCNEEVYLDEILAVQLTKFLIEHHNILLKVPENVEMTVNDQIQKISQVHIRYGDHYSVNINEEYGFVGKHNVKLRNKNNSRKTDKANRRKSADIMKSWDKLVTTIKFKPSSSQPQLHQVESYATISRVSKLKQNESDQKTQQTKRVRSSTISSRLFGSGNSDIEPTKKVTRRESKKARMKAAKSYHDIPDVYSSEQIPGIMNGAISQNNLQERSSRRGSMVFSNAFNLLRKSRDTSVSSD